MRFQMLGPLRVYDGAASYVSMGSGADGLNQYRVDTWNGSSYRSTLPYTYGVDPTAAWNGVQSSDKPHHASISPPARPAGENAT